MADFTMSSCVKNSSAAFNFLAAQESQTIDMSDTADEKVVIIAQNNNDSEAVNTATITIAAGDYLAGVLGTLSVDVADGGSAKVIGPLEGARFKGSDSKITVGVSVTQSGTVSSVKLGVVKLP